MYILSQPSPQELKERISLRKKTNKYSMDRYIRSFGVAEYFKSVFSWIFKIDTVSKDFYTQSLYTREKLDGMTNMTAEGCITNLHRISKRFLAVAVSDSSDKERILNDFRGERTSRFAKDLLEETRFQRHFDEVSKEFESLKIREKGLSVFDLDVYEQHLYRAVILIYRLILMIEQNVSEVDNVLAAAVRIHKKYRKKEGDAELNSWAWTYKQAFMNLLRYKRELYPFILKYIGEYYGERDDENVFNDIKMIKIYQLVGIDPKDPSRDIFNRAVFEKKEAAFVEQHGENALPKSVMEDYINQSLQSFRLAYPRSGIENLQLFEFILPYFYKFLISPRGDLILEEEEMKCFSKEDPVQIVICIHSIIWYDYLRQFDLENGTDNEMMAKLSKIKTEWLNYFNTLKRYAKALLDYSRDNGSRRDVHEHILSDIRREIFNLDKLYKGDSLSYLVQQVSLFLTEVDTKNIAFYFLSKERSGERIDKSAVVSMFGSMKIAIEVFRYMISDKSSFLIKKTSKTPRPTEVEKQKLIELSL